MRRFLAGFAVVSLLALSGAVACEADKKGSEGTPAPVAQAKMKEVSFVGFLTDSYCGAKNANAGGKSCALNCVKQGAKLQLLVDKTLYTLDKVEQPEKNLGVEVKVTGMLDASSNTIRVASIEPVKRG